jgi:DNA-binding XRE family transcriptional regulator
LTAGGPPVLNLRDDESRHDGDRKAEQSFNHDRSPYVRATVITIPLALRLSRTKRYDYDGASVAAAAYNQGMAIKDRLKRLRTAAGLTQQALATAAGLSISAVIHIEKGRIPDPRGSTLKALASALGTTVDALLADDPPAPAAG